MSPVSAIAAGTNTTTFCLHSAGAWRPYTSASPRVFHWSVTRSKSYYEIRLVGLHKICLSTVLSFQKEFWKRERERKIIFVQICVCKSWKEVRAKEQEKKQHSGGRDFDIGSLVRSQQGQGDRTQWGMFTHLARQCWGGRRGKVNDQIHREKRSLWVSTWICRLLIYLLLLIFLLFLRTENCMILSSLSLSLFCSFSLPLSLLGGRMDSVLKS